MRALDLSNIARALGGSVSGRNVVAPGPGHSRADRSLSIKIDPAAYVSLNLKPFSLQHGADPEATRRALCPDSQGCASAALSQFDTEQRQ